MCSCFSSASGSDPPAIRFKWSYAGGSGGSAPASIELDAASKTTRDLLVRGSSLRPKVVYSLQVTGCMEADPTVCGKAETRVTLRDEPLQVTSHRSCFLTWCL